MSRNSTPKFGEWDDGNLYRFAVTGASSPSEYPKPDDGRQIVFEVLRVRDGVTQREVLAAVFADGFQSVMAAMWQAGRWHGIREGRLEKVREIQKALEI